MDGAGGIISRGVTIGLGEVMTMINSQMEKYSAGFGLSLIVTILLNSIILLCKELNAHVISAMKAVFGHHWTTHGVILIMAFFVLGFLFPA